MGRRAYDEIRSAVEDRGGTMSYDPKGKKAWNLWLNGKHLRVEYDAGRFVALDECYTSKVISPKHHSDYARPVRPEAIDDLLAQLK